MRAVGILIGAAACGRVGFSPVVTTDSATDSATITADQRLPGPNVLGEHGGQGGDWGRAIAGTPDGGYVIAGQLSSALQIGTTSLGNVGAADVLLMSIDHDGGLNWVTTFGSAANDTAAGVAIDESGRIYITGYTEGPLDLGGGPLANQNDDAFVASFEADGTYRWSKLIGGNAGVVSTGRDRGFAVAVAGGLLVVGGHTYGTVDFGGGPTTSLSGSADLFVVGLDAGTGAYLWARRAGAGTYNNVFAVAVDATGVYATGYYEGTLDLGGGPLPQNGIQDSYILSLDRDGNFRQAVSLGSTAFDWGTSLAIDSAGNVFAGGFFSGSTSVGGKTLIATGGRDGYVAAFTSGLATTTWAVNVGGAGCDDVAALLIDDTEVIATGSFNGTTLLGGAMPVTAIGANDGFAVALTGAGGATTWAATIGTTLDDALWGIAGSRSTGLVATGAASQALGRPCGQFATDDERNLVLVAY